MFTEIVCKKAEVTQVQRTSPEWRKHGWGGRSQRDSCGKWDLTRYLIKMLNYNKLHGNRNCSKFRSQNRGFSIMHFGVTFRHTNPRISFPWKRWINSKWELPRTPSCHRWGTKTWKKTTHNSQMGRRWLPTNLFWKISLWTCKACE